MKGRKSVFILLVVVLAVVISIQPAFAKKLKLALIFHDISSPFASFYKQGGEDAAKLVDADFKFMGTSQIDLPKQVAMLENAIQSGYDGIALTIMDQKPFKRAITVAEQKGVTISSLNMDGDWGSRSTLAYAGANEYDMGYNIGKYFFKEVMQGKGKYILFPAIISLPLLIDRMDGIKKAASDYPDIELITTVEIGTDLVKAYAAVENAYTAHPEANALIGTDHFSEAIANFIGTRKLNGKVKGSCFDVTPGIAKQINNGAVQCTSDQNPYLQGFYGVFQLYMLINGKPGLEINTSSTIVTKENIGPFLKLFKIE